MKRILPIALALAMLLALAACGGEGESSDPNLGKYTCVSVESGGMTLDASTVLDETSTITLKSGGKGSIYIDGANEGFKWTLDGTTFNAVIEGEDSPGTLSDGVLVIDIMSTGMNYKYVKDGVSASNAGSASAVSADELKSWNGDWYGWYAVTDATGDFADLDGGAWDCCATITLDETGTGTMLIWDEDLPKDDAVSEAEIKLADGIVTSTGGYFLDKDLTDGQWDIDPDMADYDSCLMFTSTYATDSGTFTYSFMLRPWGQLWDDVPETERPEYYTSWYLPLVQSGAAMPDAVNG